MSELFKIMYVEEYGRNILINWGHPDKQRRYPVRSFRDAIEVIRSIEPINGSPDVTFGIGTHRLITYGFSFNGIPEGACKIDKLAKSKVFLLDGSDLEFEDEFKEWMAPHWWHYIKYFFSESE